MLACALCILHATYHDFSNVNAPVQPFSFLLHSLLYIQYAVYFTTTCCMQRKPTGAYPSELFIRCCVNFVFTWRLYWVYVKSFLLYSFLNLILFYVLHTDTNIYITDEQEVTGVSILISVLLESTSKPQDYFGVKNKISNPKI